MAGVLLEQGEDQLLPQFQGPLLALVEGDEVAGEGFLEQEVEGSGGLRREAAAQPRTAGGPGVVQDSNSKVETRLQDGGPIRPPLAGRSYGAAPVRCRQVPCFRGPGRLAEKSYPRGRESMRPRT